MTIFEKPLPPTPVLETERLLLRPLVPTDAPVIQRRFPRWEIVRYLNERVPWPYPDDGAVHFIEICQGEMARGEKHHWSIRLKDGAGRVDRHHQPLARRRAEPRHARLLARSRVPGPRPDDRGGRPGDRLRLPRARLAPPLGEQCRAQSRISPRQGKAGSTAGRLRGLSLHRGRRPAYGLADRA